MSSPVPINQTESPGSLILLDLVERAFQAGNPQELIISFLGGLVTLTGIPAAFLFLGKNQFSWESFYQVGLASEAVPGVLKACDQYCGQFASQAEAPAEPVILPYNSSFCCDFYHLPYGERLTGLLGLLHQVLETPDPLIVRKSLNLLGCFLAQMMKNLEQEKQISNLNTYVNISSTIAQALDLRDVLEAVLYFCMDSFGVEAASVLLLDYEKRNFRFYSAEGPAKPVLLMASFPADQGLAGSVLASQQAEIINNVQDDPRFFRKFDQESGFVTRNMIVLPLTAGEEKIGILQILNKFGGDFLEDELLFLQTIAEEIAFAIRNAKLFEVVVKSYCKQRQGENTCRGCKRPLGSWTPCVKYREEANLL